MLFSSAIQPLPKITAPTAAEVAVKSKPSPQGQALLKPGMTPPEYLHALEKNKLSVDSVHFLAHGLPEKDSICWAAQSSRSVGSKLSAPELQSLQSTEAWLKNPTPQAQSAIAQAIKKVDFTGPGSWTGQSALWSKLSGAASAPSIPGMAQPNLTASAVAGAILLAAGLKTGPAMPAVPQPKIAIPTGPNVPKMQLNLTKPQVPAVPQIPVVDQSKLMKPLSPFLDLGKRVAQGKVTCA